MKIFITGGNGNLGKELIKIIPKKYEVLYPSSSECDITNFDVLRNNIVSFNPDFVLHLAGFVDIVGCEKNIDKAIDTNIIGTLNLVKSCLDLDCKVVYISSEYVFKGDRGNYTINDRLDPLNIYGKTKSAAEYTISILPNYQIIRAPFIKTKYPKVYTDQYCSRYFLEDVVNKIFYNIINNSNKIIHIANSRNTLYNHYIGKKLNPLPIKIPDNIKSITPKDTSLIDNSI